MNAERIDVLAVPRGARRFVNVKFSDGSRTTLFAATRDGRGMQRDEAVPMLRRLAHPGTTLRAFTEGVLLRNGKTAPCLWLPADLRADLRAALAGGAL